MISSLDRGRKVLMILPSLRISGGVKEALRLANDLNDRGVRIIVLVLWRNSHELPHGNVPVTYLSSFFAKRSTALLQFPVLLVRFFFLVRRVNSSNEHGDTALLLTHFSTFPFAWLVPRLDWYCFNQDVEWMFVKDGLLRSCLRKFIVSTSRRSCVLTTNEYVEGLYKQEGIVPVGRLSIWPPSEWLTEKVVTAKEIDVVMLVRRGVMKRPDLYTEILGMMRGTKIRSLVITPDSDLYDEVVRLGAHAALLPSDKELKEMYAQAKIFLLLSETEGFALPPLEAMGSGCVPLCRDSGGPRSYMTGRLASNLIALNVSSREILSAVQNLLAVPRKLDALSASARASFAEGVAKSLAERNRCIGMLVETLRDSA